MEKENILVSACLLGVNCKYNGGNNYNSEIKALASKYNLIPVCPEQLGGCPTPRLPAEIQKGSGRDVLCGKAKVMRKDGVDVSENFVKGAKEVLNIAKQTNIKLAILKSKSPSCGKGKIYDGTFSGNLIDGNGVTADVLEENGITVLSEKDIDKIELFLRRD
ncbi:DUF523 domain-containing protein [Acetivibrio clariflavus]|uniref:Uncharacterized protein n=1 Tax=Acetivibrio clariflavus (strain DSM 19732 / NBRC 101661 / EBR45) TaxID=720554 RepID=G8LYV7_ACECE|nr:DUF523 domain-containing protein [Acetivibrio clariflavus]AEV67859.1 hypothetical protein Clocl_1198 [Acetivibrio clariflavus DSM 19732]HOP99785.1 DUF523 domain-containing protein [Acetivibrio clariflavus]